MQSMKLKIGDRELPPRLQASFAKAGKRPEGERQDRTSAANEQDKEPRRVDH